MKKTKQEKSVPEVELIKRELIAENQVFNIYFDDIKTQNGFEIKNYLVVSPKTRSHNQATGVAILPCRNGHIGLIKIYRYPADIAAWEIPRGFLDNNESPVNSAIRELKEETGINCTKEMMINLGTILPEPGVICGRIYLYAAINCEVVKDYVSDEIGHQEFCWFSFEELQEMIKDSVIEDATTLAAICRYHLINTETLSINNN